MTVSDIDLSPHSMYANTQPGSPGVTTKDILLILRRGWLFPLVGCLIGLAAATAYVLAVPELYKSTAQILIDKSANRFFQANKILDQPVFDDGETGSQMYVLSSESVILPVIRSMDLAHDPEFVGNLRDRGTQSSWFWQDEPPIETEAVLERTAVEKFLKRLKVSREDVGNVITLTFASGDAKKAARIVNAIVNSYIANTSEAKRRSTRMASQLLQDRLNDLKQSVVGANNALQEFKTAHNLVNKGIGLLPTEKIANLTTLLTNAKVRVAEAKARVDRIQEQKGSEEASGTIIPDNQVILGLRSKYLELSTKADEIASRVGPNHLTVVQLRKEMNDARAAIRDEEKRLAGSYVTAYQAARAQYDDLAAMVAQLSEEAKTESQAQTSIRELESTADGLLVLYKSVLEQFSQVNRQPLDPIQDASAITRAAPPLHKSSSKTLAVLVGGVALGLLCGAGGAIARELATGVFRTPEQVKQATGMYCISVPSVKASGKRIASLQPSTNSMLEELVLDAPHSRFTKSIQKYQSVGRCCATRKSR